jgi:hypothetical protein
MLLNNSAAHIHPQSAAFAREFGGKKRFENTFLNILSARQNFHLDFDNAL